MLLRMLKNYSCFLIHNSKYAYNEIMKRQVFIVWFVIFLVWAFYRAYFFFPETVDELLIKPIVFVLPVLYVVIVKEKKRIASLGLRFKRFDSLLDLYIGITLGVLFAVEGLIANWFKYGQFSFAPIWAVRTTGGLGYFFTLSLITSVWEEILGRGYLYQRLFASSKNQFWSAFVASFLFLLLHIPIMFTRLNLMGLSLLVYPLSILLLGVTNSYILALRGSLTLPILIHTFWNMTVALYL